MLWTLLATAVTSTTPFIVFFITSQPQDALEASGLFFCHWCVI